MYQLHPRFILSACSIAVALTGASAHAAIAYNDFRGGTTAPAGKFVTNFGSGISGNLLDYDTGATLASYASSGGTTTSTTGGSIGTAGTDLYNHFNGFVNLSAANFGSGSNVLTFSDLDPIKLYTVSVGINRDTAGPGDQYWFQTVDIAGAATFTNTSTMAGVQAGSATPTPNYSGPTDPSTLVDADNNSQGNSGRGTNGALVQYSNINPGSDGTFTVTLNLGTVSGSNQYINALSLEQVVPEPGSMALVALGSLLMVVRGRKRA